MCVFFNLSQKKKKHLTSEIVVSSTSPTPPPDFRNCMILCPTIQTSPDKQRHWCMPTGPIGRLPKNRNGRNLNIGFGLSTHFDFRFPQLGLSPTISPTRNSVWVGRCPQLSLDTQLGLGPTIYPTRPGSDHIPIKNTYARAVAVRIWMCSSTASKIINKNKITTTILFFVFQNG